MDKVNLHALSEDESRFLFQLVQAYATTGNAKMLAERVAKIDVRNVPLSILARLRTPHSETAQAVLPVDYASPWTPVLADVIAENGGTDGKRLRVTEGGERLWLDVGGRNLYFDLPDAYKLCTAGIDAQRFAHKEARRYRLETALAQSVKGENDANEG